MEICLSELKLLIVCKALWALSTVLRTNFPLFTIHRELWWGIFHNFWYSSSQRVPLFFHFMYSSLQKLVLQSDSLHLLFKLLASSKTWVLPDIIFLQFGLHGLRPGVVDRKVWAVTLAVTLPDQDRHTCSEMAWVRATYLAGCWCDWTLCSPPKLAGLIGRGLLERWRWLKESCWLLK